jgi:ABC-type amino acid transport substrate-binding protein
MTAGAETLRFAAESSYAPLIYVDSKSGNHAGFEVDLMKLIGKKLGAKIEIINMGFDAVIPSLVTGSVDIGGSAITITEERAKRVNFTTPYYDSGLSILINKSDEKKSAPFVGFAAQLGLEYTFWFPLQLSVDFRPSFMIPAYMNRGNWYGFAVSARYAF